MRVTILLLAALVGSTVAQLAGTVNQFTTTRFGTRKFRGINTPVACLVRERFERPTVANDITLCGRNWCNCIAGTFNENSLECFNPQNTTCTRLRTCWPDYTGCVQNIIPACTFSMVDQCMEDIADRCDEGAICRSGFIPGGISAGVIFAITAGLIYCIALLCCIGICLAGRKKRQADFDP